MSEDFESQLRALRPGKLPEALGSRLADPPSGVLEKAVVRVLFAAGVAAALAFFLLPHAPPTPAPGARPVLAGNRSSRVTGVRPLSLVTDSANRTWRIMEVSWVEESTVVAADHPAAVRLEDHYRTVVPAAVDFY